MNEFTINELQFKQWKEKYFPLFDEQIEICESVYGERIANGYRYALYLKYEAYLNRDILSDLENWRENV